MGVGGYNISSLTVFHENDLIHQCEDLRSRLLQGHDDRDTPSWLRRSTATTAANTTSAITTTAATSAIAITITITISKITTSLAATC